MDSTNRKTFKVEEKERMKLDDDRDPPQFLAILEPINYLRLSARARKAIQVTHIRKLIIHFSELISVNVRATDKIQSTLH